MLFNKAIQPLTNFIQQFSVGEMTKTCRYCLSKRFSKEILSGCCLDGKIGLPPRPEIPQRLKQLLTNTEFITNIRKYNQGLAWTSLGASIDNRLANLCIGVYTFRVQGQLHHEIGSLLPEDNANAKFGQIYFMDSQDQGQRRAEIFDLSANTFDELKSILVDANNPYVHIYQQARQICGKDV